MLYWEVQSESGKSEGEGSGPGKDGENTRGCIAEQTNNSRRGTAGHFAKWDVSEQTLQKHHASKQSIMEGIYLLAPSHLLSFTVKFLPTWSQYPVLLGCVSWGSQVPHPAA